MIARSRPGQKTQTAPATRVFRGEWWAQGRIMGSLWGGVWARSSWALNGSVVRTGGKTLAVPLGTPTGTMEHRATNLRAMHSVPATA